MDNPKFLTLTLGKPLRTQLVKNKPTFQEVAKNEFQSIQQTCKHVRSMVYHTLDEECQYSTSKVTFHSLSYVKKRTGTFYYTARVLVVVPPTEFLGDKEELQITDWLRKDKGNFLRQKYHPSVKHIPDEETKEIGGCMIIFQQQTATDEEEILKEIAGMEYEEELPNFDLKLDLTFDQRE